MLCAIWKSEFRIPFNFCSSASVYHVRGEVGWCAAHRSQARGDASCHLSAAKDRQLQKEGKGGNAEEGGSRREVRTSMACIERAFSEEVLPA
eukprot:1253761-Rhodomonas_salina.1